MDRVGTSNSAVPAFLGKEFLPLTRSVKKKAKPKQTFPVCMWHLATAKTSSLKEDGCVL